MKENCRTTMLACFIGYIVQAVVNNFTPLLFVNFQTVYGIPLAKITLLITINFLIQLCVDLVSAWLLRQDRVPGGGGLRARRVGGGAHHADYPSGAYRGPVYRHTHLGRLLRDRRRSARGAYQPYDRGVPDRQQGERDEPSPFVLLLGTRRRRSCVNGVLRGLRNTELEDTVGHMGAHPDPERRLLHEG